MPSATSDGRIEYQDELFVSRPAASGSDEDAALRAIASWVQRRMQGSEEKAICRLESPPGFGKSWTLRRFVAQYQARWRETLLIFGPFTPAHEYDAGWLSTNIDQFFCNGVYGLDKTAFRTSNLAAFQNLLVALIEDAGKLTPSRHLLFIMDDVDQAPIAEELETKLLVPLADNSARHGFSLLLAMRSDFRFRTVEQLRRPSQFERVTILPFTHRQPNQQILTLLKVKPQAQIADSEVDIFVKDLFNSLQPYTWGVPALNAEIFHVAVRKWAERPLTWTFAEIGICLLHALRLADTGEERDLLRCACAIRTAHPGGWRLDDVQRVLTMEEEQAAEFRNRMYALNLVEKPPDAAFGTYRFLSDWNSILTALASRQNLPILPGRYP